MKKNVLYVAISTGHLNVFHVPHIQWLRESGYHVDVVARTSPGFDFKAYDEYFPMEFSRSPFRLQNWRAFLALFRILRAKEYTLVHCHTPVASALTRVAALFAKGKPVVLYTAHGFHFYPGGGLSSWLVWFPAEWVLTRLTDFLVTICLWDANAAKRLLRAKRPRWIPGIGLDTAKFGQRDPQVREAYRKDLGFTDEHVVILYIGEFIPRKNHEFLISAFHKLHQKMPHVRLLLAGDGPLQDQVRQQCERLGLSSSVQLLGFRKDVPQLTWTADMAVSTSKHEGLPIGVSEAIAAGLPVVASMDRGHQELVQHGINGFLFEQNDEATFVEHLSTVASDANLRQSMSKFGQQHVQAYDVACSLDVMKRIYMEAQALWDQRHDRR